MSKRPKWIANKQTRELHRVVDGETHPPQCHFDEITDAHRAAFKTAKAARTAGFDVAAFCTRKFISKDNK